MPDFPAERAASRATPRILSVTELTRTVRDLLEGTIGEVWVEGEVCNYRKQSSGHQYFTLKDDRCQLPCVLFYRPGLRHATVPLADGMLIHARGLITVYEARGQYQMNVTLVQAAGAGLLASPTGAAIRDMLNILHRRAPWIRIVINPARVQGAGAAAEIAAAVAEFNSGALPGGPVDIIVVARGGGSAEDLWEFNEEAVARAIYASAIPVVSAVGHEIDFTISDFVADLRAPTPSAAAELVAPDSAELVRRFTQTRAALDRCVRDRVEDHRRHLGFIERSALFRDPKARLDDLSQEVDQAGEELRRALWDSLAERAKRVAALRASLREHRPDQLLAMRRQQLEGTADRLRRAMERRFGDLRRAVDSRGNLLRVLGPQATLGRGYSITRTAKGGLVRSVAQAPPKTTLITRVADGEIRSRTTG